MQPQNKPAVNPFASSPADPRTFSFGIKENNGPIPKTSIKNKNDASPRKSAVVNPFATANNNRAINIFGNVKNEDDDVPFSFKCQCCYKVKSDNIESIEEHMKKIHGDKYEYGKMEDAARTQLQRMESSAQYFYTIDCEMKRHQKFNSQSYQPIKDKFRKIVNKINNIQ